MRSVLMLFLARRCFGLRHRSRNRCLRDLTLACPPYLCRPIQEQVVRMDSETYFDLDVPTGRPLVLEYVRSLYTEDEYDDFMDTLWSDWPATRATRPFS